MKPEAPSTLVYSQSGHTKVCVCPLLSGCTAVTITQLSVTVRADWLDPEWAELTLCCFCCEGGYNLRKDAHTLVF